jgi:alkyldihydroxyacetonephosphate synthase
VKDHSLKAVNHIAKELEALLGPNVVLKSQKEIDLHSYDAWPVASKWKLQGKHPCAPDLVVRPLHVGQIQELVRFAARKGVPITPWGLGSSVTGSSLPMHGGITLDLSTMKRTLEIDVANHMVTVEAGALGSDLEREVNTRGFTLGNSPQSLDRSTVGGWLSTRATGQFSSLYGGIEDLVVRFSVVLPSGKILDTPFAPRYSLGPDLRHIFMGAEGTMGIISQVTLKMFPLPSFRHMEAIRFGSVEAGIKTIQSMIQSRLHPFLVRLYDEDEAHHAMVDPNFRDCVLFLGFEGHRAVAEAEFAVALEFVHENGGSVIGPKAVEAWMDRRFDFSTIENRLALAGGVAETIEIAHFWSGIYPLYRELKQVLAPYAEEVLSHFSHVYPQGTSMYMILLGHQSNDAEAEKTILTVWEKTMGICKKHHASIAHHHGIGIVRLPYLAEQLGEGKVVLEKVKRALDPEGIMNPGKLGVE